MTIYKHWVDFWTYPSTPQHAMTGSMRQSPPGLGSPPAQRVREGNIVAHFGPVEAVVIGSYGEVAIWTRADVVWVRKLFHVQAEVLLNAPRDPVSTSSFTWLNFVTYPQDPMRVSSRSGRLAVENAVLPPPNEDDLSEAISRGICVQPATVASVDDPFVAIDIDEQGDVAIWTKRRVWILERKHGGEKLLLASREPREPTDW